MVCSRNSHLKTLSNLMHLGLQCHAHLEGGRGSDVQKQIARSTWPPHLWLGRIADLRDQSKRKISNSQKISDCCYNSDPVCSIAVFSSSRHPASRRQTDRVECQREFRTQVAGTCICKIPGVRTDEKAGSRKASISQLCGRFHGIFEDNRVLRTLAARLCRVCIARADALAGASGLYQGHHRT